MSSSFKALPLLHKLLPGLDGTSRHAPRKPREARRQRRRSRGPFFIGKTIWVNYNDLTTTSLGIMVSKGNHPQIALIQVSELL